MKLDHRFIEGLKKHGIPDEHVRSIELLIEKLKGHFVEEMRDNLNVFNYQFRHKFADNNMVYDITEDGKLWVRKDALDKFCTEKKIAKLYQTLKQLTGWKWDDHTSTTNPQAEVSRWHDKVDEMAAAMITVLPHKDDDEEDLDAGEEM